MLHFRYDNNIEYYLIEYYLYKVRNRLEIRWILTTRKRWRERKTGVI